MAKDLGDMQLVYSHAVTLEDAKAARQTVASYALDAEECEMFLQMLGLSE